MQLLHRTPVTAASPHAKEKRGFPSCRQNPHSWEKIKALLLLGWCAQASALSPLPALQAALHLGEMCTRAPFCQKPQAVTHKHLCAPSQLSQQSCSHMKSPTQVPAPNTCGMFNQPGPLLPRSHSKRECVISFASKIPPRGLRQVMKAPL